MYNTYILKFNKKMTTNKIKKEIPFYFFSNWKKINQKQKQKQKAVFLFIY